ncbi:conserved hypothetical protein [Ricinus communis]|uniref:RNase H type-1 domain-containing protein n=1 Tax=Ricinus communis TaxID=3988 RepID=B9REL5_RICCO|nr:conserved hypothetical protein [Ricinus communis]
MAVDTCMAFLHAWKEVRMSQVIYKKFGWVKCNMDVATFENGRVIGVGLVIRDEEEQGLQRVIFESDAKVIVGAFHSRPEDQSGH